MSQQQQQGGGGGQGDNTLDFLWMMVMVIAAVALIWYFGKDTITAFIFKVRLAEVTAINFFLEGWDKFAQFVHLSKHDHAQLLSWREIMRGHNGGSVPFSDLAQVSTEVGRYLRYPIFIILASLAFVVYTRNVGLKFKNTFNMKRFKQLELVNWPQSTSTVKFDLVKTDIDEGPWAMMMQPMPFAKKHDLLKIKTVDGKPKATVIKGAAHSVFAMQLGPRWPGNYASLPDYMRALIALFLARANNDRANADQLLKQMATSSMNGKPNFSGADQLLAKHGNSKLAQRVLGGHAYIYTMISSMLVLGRTDGVLASSEFLWLKPLDRKLWYILNTMGRVTAGAEVAGIYAHWLGERAVGRGMRVPMVAEAVKGLEVAVAAVLYQPEDE